MQYLDTTFSPGSTLEESSLFHNNSLFQSDQCHWKFLNSVLETFLFLSFLINITAALIIFRVPLVSNRGRSNPVYLCIRFLNACDTIQAIVLLVMPLFSDSDCRWLGGDVSCKIWGFSALFLLLVSPLITIMMAMDRVVALHQPFKYKNNVGLQALKVFLPAACGFTFVLTVLPLFGVGEYHVVKGRRMCLLDTITDNAVDRFYAIFIHSIFLVALIFMIGCTLTFQIKLSSLSHHRKVATSLRGKYTRNATITTMLICCIFITCYSPYIIRVLLEASSGSKSPVWITWITFVLAFLQQLLNPIVCLSANARYRRELKVFFRNVKGVENTVMSDSFTGSSRALDLRRRSSTYNNTKLRSTIRKE